MNLTTVLTGLMNNKTPQDSINLEMFKHASQEFVIRFLILE